MSMTTLVTSLLLLVVLLVLHSPAAAAKRHHPPAFGYNACRKSPCKNGGRCVDDPMGFGYSCICLSGYSGRNCEIDIDECASTPCLNNGTCEDQVNGFTCLCAEGFMGDTCSPIRLGDPCSTSGDCKNTANAECRNGTCQCVLGYHYYPGPGTCVDTCPAGYGNGSSKVNGVFITGNTVQCLSLGSEEVCYSFCSLDSFCRTFDWDTSTGQCCTHYVTALQVPGDVAYSQFGVHHQMNCA